MSHVRHTLRPVVLVAVLLAAACAPTPENEALTSQSAPVDAPVAHAVRFAPNNETVSAAEGAALATFLRDAGAHRGDTVTVAGGAGALGDARRANVSAALKRMGLAAKADSATTNAGDSVVVLMPEPAAAQAADCRQWQVLGTDPLNTSAINFGCSTRTNLYLMVADPADLVAGHVPGPGDAEPGMQAVQRYREGTKPAAPGGPGGSSAGSAATSALMAPPATAPTTDAGGTSGQP